MTIKAKLIANMLVTAVIIVGISWVSFSSMRFLQGKLTEVAEKSTPFQIATVEFQRELQSCITDLITVNDARTMPEYTDSRAEAERARQRVKDSQQTLQKLNAGNRVNVSDDIDTISNELFAAVKARITSDNEAQTARMKIQQQMKESSARLNELNIQIRKLQASHAESFARVLKSNEGLSASLRNIESLRDLVNDLLSATQAAFNARNAASFRIAKGRINTILWRIAAHNNATNALSTDLRALAEDTQEFIRLQDTNVFHSSNDSNTWAFEALKALTESINTISLVLVQELELNSSKLAIETSRQGTIFAQSNSANTVLVANTELVGLGLAITGEINRLFNCGSPAELKELHSQFSPLFTSLSERAQHMEKTLVRLGATNEVKMLHAAMASLGAIRSDLQSNNGIVVTLEKKLQAIDTANDASGKLRRLVIQQSKSGNERVSVAQGNQKKSIIAVHTMLRQSIPRIAGIGTVAVLIGILFSFWIYRAVLFPLRTVLAAVHSQNEQATEKAKIAGAIAGGDLNQDVPVRDAVPLDASHMSNDEMGKLLNAVIEMSTTQAVFDRAFAEMTVALRSGRDEEDRRNHLKNALLELNSILRNEQDSAMLADKTLAFMVAFTRSKVGIMYQFDTAHETLYPVATCALAKTGKRNAAVRLGEGLVGQAALERKTIYLESVPPNYLTITSALGEAEPLHVTIVPIQYNDILAGVVELGSFSPFSADDTEFLQQSQEGIAIALNINHSRQLLNDLLVQTQQQAEELLQTNEELEERTQLQAEQQRKQRTQVKPA